MHYGIFGNLQTNLHTIEYSVGKDENVAWIATKSDSTLYLLIKLGAELGNKFNFSCLRLGQTFSLLKVLESYRIS